MRHIHFTATTLRLGMAALVVAVGIVTLGAVPGCSAGTQAPTPPTERAANVTHSIKVFAKAQDGTKALLQFAPATEFDLNVPIQNPIHPTPGPQPEAGASVLPPASVTSPGANPWSTAWALVWRASRQCGYETYQNAPVVPPWQGDDDGAAFWYVYDQANFSCTGRLYVEQNLVCVADKLAEIADAVGTVVWAGEPGASSPVPINLYNDDGGPFAGQEAGALNDLALAEWDIPPQADSDRFIVRDLAIHTLGLVPTIDAYTDISFTGSPIPGGSTCSQAWAWVANPTNTTDACQSALTTPMFGMANVNNYVPSFPPSSVPICNGGQNNAPAVAATALDIESQVLRSSGRLLHDLIRRDVYSDLAAAAQQQAQSLDPVTGSQIAWGQAPQGANGSIAHAARVLLGRWELGDSYDFGNVADPACEGTTELNLISPNSQNAFGPDLSARVMDTPIRTAGEQQAVSLVERSGIVLPSCVLPGGKVYGDGGAPAGGDNLTSLRQALIDQLALEEGLANGLNAPLSTTVLTEVVTPLADADLTFAFMRALRTWRLLTNQPDATAAAGSSCVAVTIPPGLAPLTNANTNNWPNPVSPIAPTVAALNGVVIQGGLPRSRLATDPMARAGGMTEASQCADSTTYWDEWGDDLAARMGAGGWSGNNEVATPPEAALPRAVFQDAFHIGQALGRRLNILQTATGSLMYTNPSDVAKGGIAELRSWAGNTIVHAWPVSSGGTQTVSSFNVRVAGMSYANDFNTNGFDKTAVMGAFAFVYGPPWMAECAAHVRADCPVNFLANPSQYVQFPNDANDLSMNFAPGGASAKAGAFDNVFELVVPLPFPSSNYTPPLDVLTTTSPQLLSSPQSSHLYMILLKDPSSTTGQGRVMGTLPLSGTWASVFNGGTSTWTLNPTIVGFVDAPMQRELVHDAIDLGTWVGAKPPALGDPTASQTSGYCVDGVPRDLFVPLDNELVSGTQTYEDSWQNYLSLAQQAAVTADGLGKDLIADDLAISENQQSAAEALANICGDFGSLSTSTVNSDGTITPGAADPTTSACIAPAKTDVVFLGAMPSSIQSTTDTANIKKAIGCSANPPPQTTSQLCSKSSLTADALGITTAAQSQQTQSATGLSAGCATLQGVAPSLRTGLRATDFMSALNDSNLSPNALLIAASELNMTVNLDGSWNVKYGTQTLMASDDSRYWPGCLGGAQCKGATAAPVTRTMSDTWSSVFRNCPGGNDNSTQGLGCEGVLGQSSPTGQQSVQAETNMLRWRVMQALWTIGASAGSIPQGMFSLPIPATFQGQCPPTQSGQPICNSLEASNVGGSGFPLTYVYGGGASLYTGSLMDANPSSFCGTLSNPAGGCSQVNPNSPNYGSGWYVAQSDVLSAGPIFSVQPGFTTFGASATSEIPAFYLFIYTSDQGNAPVAHVIAQNQALTFNQNPPCTVTKACTAPLPNPVPTPFTQFMSGATGIAGAVCANNYDPSGSNSNLWSNVALYKGGIVSPTDCNGTSQNYGWANAEPIPGPPSTWNSNPPTWDPSAADTNPASPPTTSSTTSPFTTFDLSPSCLTPGARAAFYIGSNAFPNGTCGSLALLLQASTLACGSELVSAPGGGSPTQIPTLSSLSQVPALQAWAASTNALLAETVAGLYVQEVPTQVVADFKANTVGSGSLSGTQGQAILTMEKDIQQFPATWMQISGDFAAIGNAIQLANGAITAAGLQDQTTLGNLALEQINVQASLAAATTQFAQNVFSNAVGSFTSFGASNLEDAVASVAYDQQITYDNQELTQLQSLSNTANQTEQNQVTQALAALAQTTQAPWADIQKQVDTLRGYVAEIDADSQNVQQAANQAAYQLAVGSGASFVSIPEPDGSTQQVPLTVNTVLARQASATEQRYQAALTNAKALAYMARRAIEQRIGVPLNALTQQIGPLDPPSAWADDICSLQGVDYSSLSTALPDGGAIDGGDSNAGAVTQFADAWVGDYVAKLQNFVTYFNVQYPSHQGDDTAVLSLRYDLLAPEAQCETQGPNLLVNSGDLSAFSPGSWERGACDANDGKCLVAVGGYAFGALQGPGDLGADAIDVGEGDDAGAPGSTAVGGVTVLEDTASPVAPVGDGGAAGVGEDSGTTATTGVPAGVIGQQVQLSAGPHVLSWWDQAVSPGAGGSGAPVPYVAQVLDPHGNAVAVFDQPPYAAPLVGDAGAPSVWSPRRTLSFAAASAGVYTVAFSASEFGTPGFGSVAIADVQLEAAAQGQPSTYVATGSTTMVSGLDCPLTDADLRAAFVHNCNSTGVCWYDLTLPLIIDTTAIGGGTPLGDKLAPGNYNYRHDTIALNLVGTNVHNCANDPNPNCYGSSYVQYTLQHDASSAGILGYDGNSRVFDFGIGSINYGKALAAEQYLTVPLSSDDQALVSQPGIQHVELSGRPLDGTYYLRIWDSPDLNWAALQDVQFILGYEYWSQVQTSGNTQYIVRGGNQKKSHRGPIFIGTGRRLSR